MWWSSSLWIQWIYTPLSEHTPAYCFLIFTQSGVERKCSQLDINERGVVLFCCAHSDLKPCNLLKVIIVLTGDCLILFLGPNVEAILHVARKIPVCQDKREINLRPFWSDWKIKWTQNMKYFTTKLIKLFEFG